MLKERRLYPLQPKQKEFQKSAAKYRLFGGAKGGGKSYAMRAECVRQCLTIPKMRGLALRRTLPEIRENMIVNLQEELPQEMYKYNEAKNLMTFFNGSTLRFSYCKNEKDVLQFQGLQYDFICIEELTHWREREFRIVMQSLRSVKPTIRPNAFFSTNPGGIGHTWVKRLWIQRKFDSQEKPDEYDFIPAKVWDNHILVETMPEYINSLLAMPEVIRRQYLEGDWNVFEGQYFPEFRDEIHVVKPKIPRGPHIVRRIVAVDYGYDAPSCALWMTQDTEGRVVVYRELYATKLTREQLFIKIKAMTPSDEKLDNGSDYFGDPSFVNKRSEDSGITGQDIVRNSTGIVVQPAINDRVDGWQVLRRFLQPVKDMDTGQTYSRLTITSNCENLIRTIPDMLFDSTKVEDLNTKLEDHALDALRYGITQFTIGEVSPERVVNMNDFFMKRYRAKNKQIRYDEEEEEVDDDIFYHSDNILTKEF